MRNLMLLAVGILGGVIPAALFAQETGSPPDASSLRQEPTELAAEGEQRNESPDDDDAFQETIVVTATLSPQELGEGLSTVTVVPRSEIDERRVYSLEDALRTVPGMTTVRTGGPGKAVSVFLRGANSNQALVLWNGLPINDPYFGAFDGSLVTTDGVDRIEVVRGPLSTVYGSSAVGGVINILSNNRQGVTLRGEAGESSYGRGSATAGWNGDFVSADLVGAWRTGDGEVDNDDYDLTLATASLRWQPRREASLGILARTLNSDIGIPRSGVMPTPNRTQDSESRELILPAQYIGEGWRGSLHLGVLDGEFRFRDPDAAFSRNDTETQRLRGRGLVSFDLREDAWIAAGGEWSEDEASNRSNFGDNLDGETQRNRAVFGQGHWQGRSITAEAGLRHDDNEVFGSQTSPSVALAYRLSPTVRVRASWAESFRAPSLGELFFPFSGNPNLQPETAASWEAAVEADGRHGDSRWNSSVVLFDSRADNLIELDFATFRNVNIGETRRRGAEFSLTWNRGPWSALGAATFLDAEDRRTGEALLRRPDEEFGFQLGWSDTVVSTRLTALWVGDRPDLDAVTFTPIVTSSYARLDWAVNWRLRRGLTPYVRIENLLDEDYEEAAGFPAPGREIVAGLEIRFGS